MKVMKNMQRVIAVLLFVLPMIGCNQDEADIIPAADFGEKYSVPQGAHEFDQKIVDFYNKCGTFILYDYDPVDVIWNVNAIISSTSSPNKVVLPEEEDLELGINTLFEIWLDLYPEDFLKKTLPKYIFVADSVFNYGTSLTYATTTKTNITVGYLNKELASMTASRMKTLKANVNAVYFTYIFNGGKIDIPEAFTAGVPYGALTSSNYREMGIIHYSYSGLTPQKDIIESLKTLMTSSQYTIDNLFKPATDKKGKIKERVAILVDEMMRLYDIDLEALSGLTLPHVE